MYQFTDDCRIGIPQIDKEHEYLFQLINTAFNTLSSSDEDCVILTKNIILKLQDYAKSHFAHEEAYMESIGDPELLLQKREHAAFTKKIEEFAALPSPDKTTLNEILLFLTRWLYHHILSSDMMIGKLGETNEKERFTFSQKFHTGIPLIDEEHKQLFAIVKETYDVVHLEFVHDKYDEIMRILAELKDYTRMHFADEEAYMERIQYPQIQAQKNAHAVFEEKLVEINLSQLDEIDNNQQEYLIELVDFLAGWLIDHILKMDKKIAEYEAGLD